jgi:hypothetical protein
VRQQIVEIKSADSDYAIVLAGDHLYRMDYQDYIQHHIDSGADITIGVLPVDQESASAFGILKMDENGRITEFTEKPKTDEALAGFRERRQPGQTLHGLHGHLRFQHQTITSPAGRKRRHRLWPSHHSRRDWQLQRGRLPV